MPFYEYQCRKCGAHHEALQKMSDAPLRKCPACGKPALKRLLSAAAFRLKGGGWYETDFKSKDEGQRNLIQAEHAEKADKPEKVEKAETAGKAETAEKAEKAEKAGQGESGAKPEAAKPEGKAAAKGPAKAGPRRIGARRARAAKRRRR
jgi:putative FmdB family regulatory protein